MIAGGPTGSTRDGWGHINLQFDYSVPPCTEGYRPPTEWRSPHDTDRRARLSGRVPVRRAVRDARTAERAPVRAVRTPPRRASTVALRSGHGPGAGHRRCQRQPGGVRPAGQPVGPGRGCVEVDAGGSGGAPVTPGSPASEGTRARLNIVLYAVALICVAAIGLLGSRIWGEVDDSDGFWDHVGDVVSDPEAETASRAGEKIGDARSRRCRWPAPSRAGADRGGDRRRVQDGQRVPQRATTRTWRPTPRRCCALATGALPRAVRPVHRGHHEGGPAGEVGPDRRGVWAGVVAVDEDSATVIVASSGTVANRTTKFKPVPRNYRLQLDLASRTTSGSRATCSSWPEETVMSRPTPTPLQLTRRDAAPAQDRGRPSPADPRPRSRRLTPRSRSRADEEPPSSRRTTPSPTEEPGRRGVRAAGRRGLAAASPKVTRILLAWRRLTR